MHHHTELSFVGEFRCFFLISEERTTTRVSPNGIPRGIYSIMYSLEKFSCIVYCCIVLVIFSCDDLGVVIGSGRVLIVHAAFGRCF